MADKILQTKNLNLSFGSKKILGNISVDFDSAEAVLIAGKNGSGKSTLLKCLSGVLLPDSGSITFNQTLKREKVGFISDKMSLLENMTLRQGIDFHTAIYGISEFSDSLIKELNLDLNGRIKHLSAGERAIYHLSLLISQQPEVLLVDEIIHTIDPFLRQRFLETLIEMIDLYNTALIMVNHTFTDTGRIPERILIMEEGRFILDENKEELLAKIRKVVIDGDLAKDLPVIYCQETELYKEYFIYPYEPKMAEAHSYNFEAIDLNEIIKSFIGGYYDKQRV